MESDQRSQPDGPVGSLDGSVIGRRIRELRIACGLTQPQLAAAAGVSKGYLWNLETHHERRPVNPAPKISLDVLARLLEPLGITVGEFLSSDGIAIADEGQVMPPGLSEFLQQRAFAGQPVPPGDVRTLVTIRMRGKRPQTAAAWNAVYEALRSFADDDR